MVRLVHERVTHGDLRDNGGKLTLFGHGRANDFIQSGLVGDVYLPTESVSEKMLAEASDEPLRVSEKNVLEADYVLKPGFPVERSTGIDRKAGPVGIAPAPDGVVVLEGKPEGINLLMAGDAALIFLMSHEPLPKGQTLGFNNSVILFDFRNDIGRGRWGPVENHGGDPCSTPNGTGPERLGGHG